MRSQSSFTKFYFIFPICHIQCSSIFNVWKDNWVKKLQVYITLKTKYYIFFLSFFSKVIIEYFIQFAGTCIPIKQLAWNVYLVVDWNLFDLNRTDTSWFAKEVLYLLALVLHLRLNIYCQRLIFTIEMKGAFLVIFQTKECYNLLINF